MCPLLNMSPVSISDPEWCQESLPPHPQRSLSAPTQSVNVSKEHHQLKPPCQSRQAALFLIAIRGELFQIQVGDEERLRISTWKDIWGWAPFKANRALEQWRVLLWLVEAGMDYSHRHLFLASQPCSSNMDRHSGMRLRRTAAKIWDLIGGKDDRMQACWKDPS